MIHQPTPAGGASCRLSSSPRAFPICEIYFGLESGGQSGRASMGLPPLCTVGAADFEPPASGRTALFSTAMEFDVLSPALPDVAAVEVVQLVSCFSLDGAVDWATAGPTTNDPAKIAAPTRLIILSLPKRKDDVHKSRAERSRVTKGSGSILLRRMIPEVLRVSDAGRSRRCGLHRGRRPKAFNERNRGKWQAMVPRALWGFSRGT